MAFWKKETLKQNEPEQWIRQWKNLVPPENRDVEITVDGESVIAFVQINQFALMLQDGLLMENSFFDVCSFFQHAGYHVIWLMRCTQDIHNGYLKQKGRFDGGQRCRWSWKSPTTNFGRWISDNRNATILLQCAQLPEGDITLCEERILQRVTWAESDDAARMIPSKTKFYTVDNPGSPAELLRWLQGTSLNSVRKVLP